MGVGGSPRIMRDFIAQCETKPLSRKLFLSAGLKTYYLYLAR